ncbi:HsdM family class I SAM-dependent methyltransferase [Spiroplasma endosymbiont of Cantharis rufa]|uniref:HsdM family class I SAM-dependent methyltransferase n=1 Tax=Spiroplasma endosymbiont of Cantharis rufa TaxID=3066279 RepID=UPI0030D1E1BA
MANERITEGLVRKKLMEYGYYDNNIVVEEQQSKNPIINSILLNASKSGSGNKGFPEFIITKPGSKLLIVIECKPLVSQHVSEQFNKPKDFAVDGVLSYAKHLSKEYDVIAIGCSGQNINEFRSSFYFYPNDKKSLGINEALKLIDFISFQDFEIFVDKSTLKNSLDYKLLTKNTKDIHKLLRTKINITDELKPVIISAILLSLSEQTFRDSYKYEKNAKSIFNSMITTIENKFSSIVDFPKEKQDICIKKFKELDSLPLLVSIDSDETNFMNVILNVEKNILPYIKNNSSFDYIGEFYKEFLKYTDGNKKGLGIVLTPNHITELFAELAELTIEDIVIDPCCGTGGFLIAAMNNMIAKTSSQSKKNEIKQNQLIGIEVEPKMFTLAASNMIIRGDGKANLYLKNCFDPILKEEIISKHKPSKGFINPPYSQDSEKQHELDFTYNMLNIINKNGIGICIVPINTASSLNNNEINKRRKIMEKHTLLASMSMPENLFYPVGVVTCIMVFRAHVPHDVDKKTWFANWKDDGFVITRGSGRTDRKHTWKNERKKEWISMYKNQQEVKGISLKRAVDYKDEWCVEAYLEPDYDSIEYSEFKNIVQEFIIYKNIFSEEIGDNEDEDN